MIEYRIAKQARLPDEDRACAILNLYQAFTSGVLDITGQSPYKIEFMLPDGFQADYWPSLEGGGSGIRLHTIIRTERFDGLHIHKLEKAGFFVTQKKLAGGRR